MSIWDDYTGSTFNPINWGKREDPGREANKYLDQIPGMAKDYYNPFIEGGKQAEGILRDEYGKLLNPTDFMDKILNNYSLSKGAQYKRDLLGKGIGATAASGGYAGTPEHQRAYGEMADKIMSGDMQEYLQNALGIYNTGLSGEKDFYNKGFDATQSLVDALGGVLGSKAGVAFQGATQTNADRSAFVNALAKALSSGAGASFG